MIERLKHMEKTLLCCVEKEFSNLDNVDAKELGEAIDMIKDLSEAIYYCTITHSMEDTDWKKKGRHHEENREHEGMSHLTRKTYMERQKHGGPKEAQMHELEKYVQELSEDIMEMIEDATHEEKQMLQRKLSAFASKIV